MYEMLRLKPLELSIYILINEGQEDKTDPFQEWAVGGRKS
jgi:hypothetical protein